MVAQAVISSLVVFKLAQWLKKDLANGGWRLLSTVLLALVSVATAWVRQTVRSGTVILGLGAFFSSAA